MTLLLLEFQFTFLPIGCGNKSFEIFEVPSSGLTLTIGSHRMSQSRSESCSNIIRIPDNQRLRLTVHSLDSNCLGSYSQYSYDWLEIHDGINQGKPLIRKRLCDEFAMKPFTSISNELLVRFESETYGERIGYNITIEKGIMLQLSLSIAKFDKFLTTSS